MISRKTSTIIVGILAAGAAFGLAGPASAATPTPTGTAADWAWTAPVILNYGSTIGVDRAGEMYPDWRNFTLKGDAKLVDYVGYLPSDPAIEVPEDVRAAGEPQGTGNADNSAICWNKTPGFATEDPLLAGDALPDPSRLGEINSDEPTGNWVTYTSPAGGGVITSGGIADAATSQIHRFAPTFTASVTIDLSECDGLDLAGPIYVPNADANSGIARASDSRASMAQIGYLEALSWSDDAFGQLPEGADVVVTPLTNDRVRIDYVDWPESAQAAGGFSSFTVMALTDDGNQVAFDVVHEFGVPDEVAPTDPPEVTPPVTAEPPVVTPPVKETPPAAVKPVVTPFQAHTGIEHTDSTIGILGTAGTLLAAITALFGAITLRRRRREASAK